MILFLRLFALAAFTALLVIVLSKVAGWHTTCAVFPHCDFVLRDSEMVDYYIRNLMPR